MTRGLWRAAALLGASALASPGGGAAAADPMAICQAANPQFPQLCGCAIDRAHAAGIDGASLDKLLSNDFVGVPLDAVQRYGLIFVECTQAAVMQQMAPGMAVPGVPGAPPAQGLPGQVPPVAALPGGTDPAGHGTPAPVAPSPVAPPVVPQATPPSPPTAPVQPAPGIAATPGPSAAPDDRPTIDLDPPATGGAGSVIDLDPPSASDRATPSAGAPVIDLDLPTAQTGTINLDPPIPGSGATIDLDPPTTNSGAVIDLDPPTTGAGIDLDPPTGAAPINLDPPSAGSGAAIDLDPPTGGAASGSQSTAPSATIDLDPAPSAAPATAGYRLELPQGTPIPPAGTWFSYAALKRNDPFPAWADTIITGNGTTDDRGTILMTACSARSAPAIVVGPLRDPATLASIAVEVRGAGGILHEQTAAARWIEQDLGYGEFLPPLSDALRRGSSVILRLRDAGGAVTDTLTFGLRGSSDALRFVRCSNDRPWLSSAPGGFGGEWVRGTWAASERWDDDPRGTPALTLGQPNAALERLTLTCDRRFILDPAGKYVAPPGFETGLAFTLSLFVDGGAETDLPARFASAFATELVTTDPLPAPLLAAMAAGQRLTVGRGDMEPGDMMTRSFDLAGFAAGLEGLACPPPPEPPAATARTDLTGLGLAWQPGDIGESQPRNVDGTVQSVPVAWLDHGRSDLPNLGLYCGGYPYFLGGDFPVRGDATLRLTVDGDPARSGDVTFGSYRAFMNGSPDPALAQAILSGRTLRVTLLEDTRADVLYPLDGAAMALSAAGCPD